MNAFVGRTDELAALVETADAALRGDVAAAVVLGDPGSGKSRLLGEAAARADLPNQFRVVGFEPESAVPLAAASEFLRALAAATPHGRQLEELVYIRCGPRPLRAAADVEPAQGFDRSLAQASADDAALADDGHLATAAVSADRYYFPVEA